MNLIPINQVVSEFLDEINGGQAEFSKAYRIAIRGLRELTYDITGEVQNSRISLNCDMTADLPDDCIKVLRVGYLNGSGEFVALRENGDLSIGDKCGDYADGFNDYKGYKDNIAYIGNLSINSSVYPTFQHFLGVGSYSNTGDYKIEGNLIYFSNNIQDFELAVEYLSLPKIDGNLAIHPFVSEALVAYIRYYYNIGRKDVTGADKGLYRMEMKRAFTLAKNRLQSPNKQELNQYARQNTKAGLKS